MARNSLLVVRVWADRVCLLSIAAVTLNAAARAAQKQPAPAPWAFAAIADNRGAPERPEGTYEGVLREIRDMKSNPAPKFPAIEFVVACGDVKNTADDQANWKLWKETFKGVTKPPCYYPLIGNWDYGDEQFNRTVILPAQKNVVGKDPTQFYVDWKNVRLIVARADKYVEDTIKSAPAVIDHVFVADHYPIFPRRFYQQRPSSGDVAFWKMLLRHRGKVKAYLTGHTHNYSKICVADPEGRVAKDLQSLPDEPGGIYQIDCGSAGTARHSEGACTIVEIMVSGKSLRYRALQAANETPSEFKVKEEW